MSKIEVGRYSELLRRQFGMKGQEQVSGELSPEISPTIELEGPSAEWDFLKGVRGAAVGLDLAGVVANISVARLRNPVDSGVIATIRAFNWGLVTNGEILAARGTEVVDLGLSTVGTTVLDQRWQTGTSPQSATLICSVTNLDAVGVVGRVFFRSPILSRVVFPYPLEIVLVPGTNLDWSPSAVNVRLFANAFWNERHLPALEA